MSVCTCMCVLCGSFSAVYGSLSSAGLCSSDPKVHTRARTYAHMQGCTRARSQARTYAHTCIHAYAHIRTQPHTDLIFGDESEDDPLHLASDLDIEGEFGEDSEGSEEEYAPRPGSKVRFGADVVLGEDKEKGGVESGEEEEEEEYESGEGEEEEEGEEDIGSEGEFDGDDGESSEGEEEGEGSEEEEEVSEKRPAAAKGKKDAPSKTEVCSAYARGCSRFSLASGRVSVCVCVRGGGGSKMPTTPCGGQGERLPSLTHTHNTRVAHTHIQGGKYVPPHLRNQGDDRVTPTSSHSPHLTSCTQRRASTSHRTFATKGTAR